jgi:hypothetical protein
MDQGYYLLLKTSSGTIRAYGRSEDAYPAGQLWINGDAVDADLSFRTGYDYGSGAVWSDLQRVLANFWLALPLILVLTLPGWLLSKWAGKRGPLNHPGLDWGGRAAMAIGLSLAVIPIAMLWTSAAGLRWQRTATIVFSIAMVLLSLWYFRGFYRQWVSTRKKDYRVKPQTVALAFIFVVAAGVRLAMVRDMAAPAWVDSVHHATITQLIIEQGGFPTTYSPSIPTSTANYHPGFHSALAAFFWLSGLDLSDAMLLLGQVLNALCVFAVYLLTYVFTGSPVAGLGAALITGLFTPMPAYYTSWGRYTQLAGLLILPAAMFLVKLIIEGQRSWKIYLLAGLACAGLFLTHYRVAGFLGCLILAYWLTWVLKSSEERAWRSNVAMSIARMAGIGLIAILFALPWLPNTISSLLIPRLTTFAGRPAFFGDFAWGYLTPAYGKGALVLAGLGLAWAILRARQTALTILLWVGFLLVLANLAALNLPGGSFVNNSSVEIMLFMPISLLGGFFLANAVQIGARITPRRGLPLYRATIVLGGAILVIAGARVLLPILNPITMLYREADTPALAWIGENVPPGETIAINPFLWGYGLYAGSDGGFWITPSAGRNTMPPPVLYALLKEPEIVNTITNTSRQMLENAKDPVALHALLQSQGIHYLFIGAKGGAFSARALRESDLYELIYDRDGTWLFKLR